VAPLGWPPNPPGDENSPSGGGGRVG